MEASCIKSPLVRDFVGHHSGELGFFLRAENQPAVDVEKAAGKGEGIHFVRVDYLYGEGHTRVGIANQILPNAVYVFGDDRVVHHLG